MKKDYAGYKVESKTLANAFIKGITKEIKSNGETTAHVRIGQSIRPIRVKFI